MRTFPNIHDFHPQLRIADAPPDQSRIEHKRFDKTIARAAQYLILFRFADSAGGIGAAVYCECLCIPVDQKKRNTGEKLDNQRVRIRFQPDFAVGEVEGGKIVCIVRHLGGFNAAHRLQYF